MRRVLTVLAIALAVILAVAGVIYLAERDKIDSLILIASVSEEELALQRDDSKAALEDEFSRAGIDLAAIEAQAMAESAEKSPPAENDAISDETAPPPNDVSVSNPPQSGRVSRQRAQAKDTAEIEAILAQFYQLQGSYTGRLEGILGAAIAQYQSLPEEEHTRENMISIGSAALSSAFALEGECDAQVASYAEKLRVALERQGMDTGLADQITPHYVSVKNAQKAAYLSKYKKYLS